MRRFLSFLIALIALASLPFGAGCGDGDDDDAAGDAGDDTATGDDAADDDSADDDSADDDTATDDDTGAGDDTADDDSGDDDTGFVCDHEQGYVPETAKVHAIDVAGGEAIYIQTQWDYNVLIGTGADDPAHAVVGYLRDNGVVRLQELVLASVLDEDLGEVPDILAAFPVDLVRATPATGDSPAYVAAMKAIGDAGIEVVTHVAGDTLPWLGAEETVLGPKYPFPAEYTDRDKGLVIRFSVGRIDFLLAGAITAVAERDIVDTFGEGVCAEALKVSYHGAGDATDEAFLAGVDPETAVIVAGWNNPEGFPAQATLDKLDARLTLYGITGHLGNMVWQTDGWDVWFCDG
jgi:beta-lactamase superfamily II metal-dependent hydrolase